MAYSPGRLALLLQPIGRGPRRWSYYSPDAVNTITAAGYISDAVRKGVQLGDLVDVFSGTLNPALTSVPSTAAEGSVSSFSAVPTFAACMVSAISAGAATLTVLASSVGGAGGGNPGVECIFQKGGDALVANLQADLEVQSDCTLISGSMFADQVGSAVVNVWRCTYAQFHTGTHPVAGDKITGTNPLTIAGNDKSTDLALATWTVQLHKGDVLRLNIDSVTTITRLTISLCFATTDGAGSYRTEDGIAAKGASFATVSPASNDLVAGFKNGVNVNFLVSSLGGGSGGGSGNIDGGNPSSIYLTSQIIDGGGP